MTTTKKAKNTIILDHEHNKLVMTKTFAKKSTDVRSDEYRILQEVRNAYPTYAVITREIKKNKDKESYKGLTYAYMRKYIDTVEENEESRVAAHAEMDRMVLISQCHSQSKRYPVIKKWFLDKYPEVKKFGVPKEEASAEEETAEVYETVVLPAKTTINVADFPTSKTA